jgi:hypothetical protein
MKLAAILAFLVLPPYQQEVDQWRAEYAIIGREQEQRI